MSFLRPHLVGKTIEALHYESGYYLLRLADGSGMSIANFKGDYDNRENQGAVIDDLVISDDEIVMKLSTGNELTIRLRAEDYVGPEAFHFFDPKTGTSIVN